MLASSAPQPMLFTWRNHCTSHLFTHAQKGLVEMNAEEFNKCIWNLIMQALYSPKATLLRGSPLQWESPFSVSWPCWSELWPGVWSCSLDCGRCHIAWNILVNTPVTVSTIILLSYRTIGKSFVHETAFAQVSSPNAQARQVGQCLIWSLWFPPSRYVKTRSNTITQLLGGQLQPIL